MKMISRKAFTVVELVVTIALLSLSTGLVIGLIVNFTNIQNSSTTQYLYNEEIQKVDDIANDYISYVSLNNDEVSFTYYSSNDTSICFKHDGYSYSLAYSDSNLSITNDYDGDVDYFKKSRVESLNHVSSIKFNYIDAKGLLRLNLSFGDRNYNLDYIVRTEL